MKVEMKILDARLGTDWPLPRYSTEGAGALDMRACTSREIVLRGGDTHKVPTGVSINIHDPGVAALVLPRSGLGTAGLVLGNLVGLIDSDYQGEIFLGLWNRNDYDHFTISPGDRVAQLLFVPVIRPEFEVVTKFSTTTERGENGCGHTGVQ